MVNLFRWRAQKPETGNPFGLTDDDLALLRNLREQPGYVKFNDLLRDIAETKGVLLLLLRESNDLHYWRGFVTALRETITLLDAIEAKAKANDAQRAEANGRSHDRDWRNTFYGTNWFDSVRRWRSTD